MKLGLALDFADPARRLALAQQAEARGFESVWLAARAGEDGFAALAKLAVGTRRVRLALLAHDLAGRPPLESAREIASLDRACGGRLEVGVTLGGAPGSAEALTLCKRLWCDPWVEHRGARFAVEGVSPSERPAQRPWSPLHVEGESEAALALAARAADGWISVETRAAELARSLRRLRELRARAETLDGRFSVSVLAAAASASALADLERVGVERAIVSVEASAWRE